MSPTWRRRRAGRSPAPNNWVEAKQALFVIGSRIKGGMGADEAVPFSDRAAAEQLRVRERRARPRLRGGAAGLCSRRRDRYDEFGRGNPVHSECRPRLSPHRQQGRPRTLRRSHGAFRHPPARHRHHGGGGRPGAGASRLRRACRSEPGDLAGARYGRCSRPCRSITRTGSRLSGSSARCRGSSEARADAQPLP